MKAAIKLPDRSATSKHQTLTFLVLVSADKHEDIEESTETALGAVYKTDVDAAVQMEAPGADYAGAAMKATHYADVTRKAVNCIRCHMACGGGERVIYMKMCIQNYEVTSDAHIIFMYTSSCFENT